MPMPYRGKGELYFAYLTMMERPELGGRIAAISAAWTFVEDAWGTILAVMLGLEAGAGIAMYHSLTGTGAQRSVLRDMADIYLSDPLREEFGRLITSSKGRATERNDIVHGYW